MIIPTDRMVFCPPQQKYISMDICCDCKYFGGFMPGTLDIYCNIPMENK